MLSLWLATLNLGCFGSVFCGCSHLPAAEIGLSDELIEFHKVATEFSANELAPYAAKWDDEKIFPEEALRKAAALGFGGMLALCL